MKLAVLSDIHGNLPALETVIEDIDRWKPDLVVVNGDILNWGPRPTECLEVLLERKQNEAWILLKGNHEEYVLNASRNDRTKLSDRQREYFATSYFTLDNLTASHIAEVEKWDESYKINDSKFPLSIFHASIHSNYDGLVPRMTDDELIRKIDPASRAFVTSHTHFFFERKIADTLIVNTGSVGRPLDRRTETGYARLVQGKDGWQAELVRLEYDRAKLMQDCIETGFSKVMGPFFDIMLREWQDGRGRFANWRRAYEKDFLEGRISSAESVARYLADIPAPQ